MSDNEQATNDAPAPASNATRETSYMGRVKWFNNRAGYGFTTVLDQDKKGIDVFVHHSGVHVDNEQYRYLVQGEYVSFNVSKSDNKDHKCQATNVRGILGGRLMCETHLEMRKERDDRMRGSEFSNQGPPHNNNNQRYQREGGGAGNGRTHGGQPPRRQHGRPRQYGAGPREETDGFVLARKGRHPPATSPTATED